MGIYDRDSDERPGASVELEAALKDSRGITCLTKTYDSNGSIDTEKQADGGVFDFDASGNVTQTDVTNPRGYPRTGHRAYAHRIMHIRDEQMENDVKRAA